MGIQVEVGRGVGVTASSPRVTALLPQCRRRLHRFGSGGATGSSVSVIMIFDLVDVGVYARKSPSGDGEAWLKMRG